MFGFHGLITYKVLIIGQISIDYMNKTSRIQYLELSQSGISLCAKNVLFIENLSRNIPPFPT